MKYWYINQLECVAKDGDLVDFVVIVYWSRIAKEIINKKEYFATINNSLSFLKNDVIDFIPYENLTYEIVCSWLNSNLNTNILDLNLDAQINNQLKPPTINLPLPFENPINSLNI
jgi:hypothetical protein